MHIIRDLNDLFPIVLGFMNQNNILLLQTVSKNISNQIIEYIDKKEYYELYTYGNNIKKMYIVFDNNFIISLLKSYDRSTILFYLCTSRRKMIHMNLNKLLYG